MEAQAVDLYSKGTSFEKLPSPGFRVEFSSLLTQSFSLIHLLAVLCHLQTWASDPQFLPCESMQLLFLNSKACLGLTTSPVLGQ